MFLSWFLMLYVMLIMFIFFFKQKTAYEMRISDWSSDVCSSDLADCRMRTALDNPCRAVFRAPVRRRGQSRCLAPVRNRKRARTWRAVPRCAAGCGKLPGLCAAARARGDPDRLFRRRPLCRSNPRPPGARQTTGPPEIGSASRRDKGGKDVE